MSLMTFPSVHRRARFVVPASLGLLLPDGDAVAQHPQKLRLEIRPGGSRNKIGGKAPATADLIGQMAISPKSPTGYGS